MHIYAQKYVFAVTQGFLSIKCYYFKKLLLITKCLYGENTQINLFTMKGSIHNKFLNIS